MTFQKEMLWSETTFCSTMFLFANTLCVAWLLHCNIQYLQADDSYSVIALLFKRISEVFGGNWVGIRLNAK